jgi:hypothetical protein
MVCLRRSCFPGEGIPSLTKPVYELRMKSNDNNSRQTHQSHDNEQLLPSLRLVQRNNHGHEKNTTSPNRRRKKGN